MCNTERRRGLPFGLASLLNCEARLHSFKLSLEGRARREVETWGGVLFRVRPLLYLLVCNSCDVSVGFANSEEDEEKPDTQAQAEEGKVEVINRQPRFTGRTTEPHNDGCHPDVTFKPDQGRTVETHYDEGHSNATFEPDQGYHQVTVEIHPRHNTPKLENKVSFRKGIRVLPIVTGQENKGFQDDREERPKERPTVRRDLYAYPWDKFSLKSMPIDLQQFKRLDAYASKVSVRNSVENLVSVLLQEARSDLEKVRAIWMWICHHIEYDVEGFHNKAKRSCKPEDVLRSGKSVCAGYAGLFEQMCSIAGIQCKTLSGFSKGYSYSLGQAMTGDSDHAWNAVYLDGRWHLLDSTWGSGSVDDSCRQFTFRYNEFYFLTHPALFVNDHFPEDHKWQLLEPPLTLQQFGDNVRCRSDFYSVGLVAASPGTSVFETENGKATVFIENRSPALFLSKLNGVNDHCLMTLQRNGMKLEVYPQRTGTHKLDIYAKSSTDKRENYSHVLEYSLKCSSVNKSIHLPKALIQPVGPSWHSEEKGILRASPLDPVIHTDDGRCVVTFTQSEDLGVFATLDSDTSSVPDATRRRHIWKTCRGNQVELMIHLPHAGDFALHIWAKQASDQSGNHCALSYLLSCPNRSARWPVFPQSYTNWEDGYELVAPLAGILPANRKVQFKLRLPGIAKVSVECGKTYPLSLSQEGFWEGACHTSAGSQVTVRVFKTANSNTSWSLLEYKVEAH
ncbi:kyphoscoliosis peptidase-like [Hemicordylus capensis]|uniref:kyphoscoliosis peptidase-like n=1 Tax=Hemicordylus capensis TaxID=884348 RepID=UPI0023032403|nr:kyphoscoliosis peptidase-like [Hemicordylus capensis]